MIDNKRILNVLVINKDFVRAKVPVGIVERDFFRSLSQDRYNITVFCSDEKPQVELPFASVNKVKDFHILKLIPGIAFRMGFTDLYNVPDRSVYSWAWRVRQSIKKKMRSENFDYIHSNSFPNSCHAIALKLKKYTGLPWIAQFYDPWVGSAFVEFKTNYFKNRYVNLERQIAENADIIVHDNDLIVEDWVSRYGEEIRKKIIVLPIVLDPSRIATPILVDHKNENCLVLSHIGNFYKGRSSYSFIQAVSQLIQKYPNYRKKLKIYYIGTVGKEEKNIITNSGVSDIFYLTGNLSQEECVKYYECTNIFLSIDSGIAGGELCFPSKILKYFYFQKPILGITPEYSVLWSELNKSGHFTVKNEDVEGIVTFLERAIDDYDSLLNFNKDYYRRFLPETIMEQYNDTVDKLLAKS